MTPDGRVEILVFVFEPPAARLEGGLAGALERAEAGGALRVLEVFAAGRDSETGEPWAIRATGGAGGLFGTLVDLRLDADRRRRWTEAVLAETCADHLAARQLIRLLTPGAAVVVAAVEHVWHATLTDAVARSGGWTVADELGAPEDPGDLASHALSVLRRADAAQGC